jgi:hypothetical protein
VNNDCSHAAWPGLAGTNEGDNDGDGFTTCAGDCDDANTNIYPGAAAVCDGFNNDCNDPDWPSLEADTIEYSSCLIDVTVDINGDMTWESSTPYTPWNVYRSDMEDLKPAWSGPIGHWTQEPGSNTIAAQDCAVPVAQHADTPDLAPGDIAFYLVTGLTGSVESGLGWQPGWYGFPPGERTNDNPCQ